MEDVVIVSAVRTPVGSFNGAFGSVPAHDLGTAAIRAAIERAGLQAADIDEAIMGQVLAAAQGRTRRARRRAMPACRTRRPRLASTSSAAAACARWPWPPSRCAPAKAPSWWPAAWKA